MKTVWEQYEEDFLREVSTTMTAAEIAEKLERSESAVFNKAMRLGVRLTSKFAFRKWTPDEVRMITELPADVIAERTGRSIYSVKGKIERIRRGI
ncbi:hypothetical protein [Pluralibacter gergoviae]|uniref:hypothetical protein n=1 Tax=Pluralibacter gergoviae TaxID=61647 RepID=UPI0006ACA43B|nr:hypothetical protein [Pluralibacter gergoviae]KOQ93307.1 hypothetical protein ABW48_19890 [Pluralibacter gergoviae]